MQPSGATAYALAQKRWLNRSAGPWVPLLEPRLEASPYLESDQVTARCTLCKVRRCILAFAKTRGIGRKLAVP